MTLMACNESSINQWNAFVSAKIFLVFGDRRVKESRISHTHDFKCRKLVITSYFSRVLFFILFFVLSFFSVFFSLSLFLSLSPFLRLSRYIFVSTMPPLLSHLLPLFSTTIFYWPKKKKTTRVIIWKKTLVQGNRQFEVCVFVYLEVDCPRDIEHRREGKKHRPIRRIHTDSWYFCKKGE